MYHCGTTLPKHRVRFALARVLLRCRPCNPCSSKWTKIWQTLDVFMLALINNTCPVLLAEALGDLKYHEGCTWGKVQGVRNNAAMSCLSRPIMPITTVILQVCVEPLRHLTMYFLTLSHTSDASATTNTNIPCLSNLVNVKYSILTSTLQYYSALVAGKSLRVWIVYQAANVTSAEEFRAKVPWAAICLRRCDYY